MPSNTSRDVTNLYEQAKVYEEAYNTWRALLKQGKLDEAREYFQDRKADISQNSVATKIKAAEAKISVQIRVVERGDADPDAKKERIKGLRDIQDRLARLVVPK